MGALSIATGPNTTYATADLSGTSLTITPKAAGTTSLQLKEANGNKTATINIEVKATSITASPTSVTANVSDGAQTVTLGGTNAGAFSIVTGPDSAIATANLSGNTLTIIPVAKGTTSVVVKEANGNKQVTISITVSAGVTASDIPASDYGAIVNGYDCTNSAAVDNWKLFYADDSNIYLIADDYIPYENIPSNSQGHRPIQGNKRGAYFEGSNVINDYNYGSITDQRIKDLNSDLYVKNYMYMYDNIKSTAYMLDIETWNVYAGDYAEYAIGGPTAELFLKSYNEKYKTNYVAEVTNSYGYSIKDDSESSTYIMLPTTDLLYFAKTENADGMWLGSPSAYGSTAYGSCESYLVSAYSSSGLFGFYSFQSNNRGFRPVVCLKPDVKLQKNSDGSYTIVDEETPGGETGGIASADVPAEDYGAIVYLIADDYISNDYMPACVPSGDKPSTSNNFWNENKKGVHFDKVMENYTGSSDITDSRIKALNSDFFNLINDTNCGYPNMRTIAYLLDINIWNVYAGEYAEYAIGTPTIELLFKSCNEKYNRMYVAGATGNIGYELSESGVVMSDHGIDFTRI